MAVKEKAVDSSISVENIPNAYEKVYQASLMPGELVFHYKEQKGENVMKNGDAYVTLGKDNPGQTEGYRGNTNAASVDMVVGRYGNVGKEYIKDLQERSNTPSQLPSLPQQYAENNYKLDAARITLSQKTDIDDNFYLTDVLQSKGSVDAPAKNKSAIGMKADNVRMVSRESIKLVAMTDGYNSKNRRIGGEYGIELIAAGNSNKGNTDLQPLVKGNNLVAAMNDLVEHIATLDTQISQLGKMVLQQQKQFLLHFHNATAPGAPTTPPIDPNSFIQGILTSVDLGMQTIEINLRQFKHAEFTNNYLVPGARSYICSPHNKTT